ncbi:MAG: hypothetical protein HY981_01355 [Candidatus Magasanikbacteria bacterium]|nr:hypothetical protein [Candidatus Magasanikbacteria bacterium]
METQERGGLKSSEKMIEEINLRVLDEDEKVKKIIFEVFIPNIIACGKYAENWLTSLENDFYTLVNHPSDPCGSGQYEGRTPQEIQRLYFVLYGTNMEP